MTPYLARASLPTFAVLALALPGAAQDRRLPAGIRVRAGYELSVAEATLAHPRFLRLDPAGTLYVSRPDAGDIQACRDRDGDGYYETVAPFVQDHRTVHGLCWYDGWLWFSESGAIYRAQDTDGDGRADQAGANGARARPRGRAAATQPPPALCAAPLKIPNRLRRRSAGHRPATDRR